jgi:hypothetical protein
MYYKFLLNKITRDEDRNCTTYEDGDLLITYGTDEDGFKILEVGVNYTMRKIIELMKIKSINIFL